jgi:hypothetical protein
MPKLEAWELEALRTWFQYEGPWSQYILASDPKGLRSNYEGRLDSSDVSNLARGFLEQCEREARELLTRDPLPPGPGGFVRTDPSHIKYLSEFGTELTSVQSNAVEILRIAFSLECYLHRGPFEKPSFLDTEGVARIILESMMLTAALIRGNVFKNLFPHYVSDKTRTRAATSQKKGKAAIARAQRLEKIEAILQSLKRQKSAKEIQKRWRKRYGDNQVPSERDINRLKAALDSNRQMKKSVASS